MTHLSSDISRIDYCAQWFHAVRGHAREPRCMTELEVIPGLDRTDPADHYHDLAAATGQLEGPVAGAFKLIIDIRPDWPVRSDWHVSVPSYNAIADVLYEGESGTVAVQQHV